MSKRADILHLHDAEMKRVATVFKMGACGGALLLLPEVRSIKYLPD